jgi:hypothetical protein
MKKPKRRSAIQEDEFGRSIYAGYIESGKFVATHFACYEKAYFEWMPIILVSTNFQN